MKLKYILYMFVLVALMTSCELTDNIDPTTAQEVSAESLVTTSEINLVKQMVNLSMNYNVTNLMTQYHSEVTYVTESRYNFADRKIPDAHWGVIYRDVLTNLKAAQEIVNKTSYVDPGQKVNQLAILSMLKIYSYQLLVDVFGNVPYTQANLGMSNSRPKYDDAKTVYYSLIDSLNYSIKNLSTGSAGFGSADLIYSSNIGKWIKFGNSLKLRFALRIADIDLAKAKTMASEAVAGGIIASPSESAILAYTGTSPYVGTYYDWYVLNARKDYVPSKTLMDKMNTLNDPRRPILFTTYNGNYVGLTYGLKGASSYSKFSHFTSKLLDASYPAVIIDPSETEFLLAEAVERGFAGISGTAADHYNNAITTNLTYWGVASADIASYLSQPTVSYATAAATWKEKIGTQKWLALYDRCYESWAEQRRLDFPVLTPPVEMTKADIPVRYPYPYDEVKYNKTNYTAAAAAIGGDLPSTKLFWDKY